MKLLSAVYRSGRVTLPKMGMDEWRHLLLEAGFPAVLSQNPLLLSPKSPSVHFLTFLPTVLTGSLVSRAGARDGHERVGRWQPAVS